MRAKHTHPKRRATTTITREEKRKEEAEEETTISYLDRHADEDEEEIRGSQGQQEDVGHSAHAPVVGDGEDDQAVAHQTQQQGQRVGQSHGHQLVQRDVVDGVIVVVVVVVVVVVIAGVVGDVVTGRRHLGSRRYRPGNSLSFSSSLFLMLSFV